jgi:hypothetical protein
MWKGRKQNVYCLEYTCIHASITTTTTTTASPTMQKHTQVKKKERKKAYYFPSVFFLLLRFFLFHPKARKNKFLLLYPVDMPCAYIQQKRKEEEKEQRFVAM